jgi:thiamine biosynthesis lipoprotein
MTSLALARHAMATRFELVLHGNDPLALRAAGEEALDEVERLEAELSLYRPASAIAHVNARAAREPVRVAPGLFRLLEHAQRLHRESGGAFDVTIGPLVRCWGFLGGTGALPEPAAVAAAREKVGMHLVELNAADFTVRFRRDGVMLDLGAVGKGYAVERAVELLREAGVASALLHGGTSTIYGIGHPPDAEAWNVAVEYPAETPGASAELLAVVPLRDEAFSVSAVWGRSFQIAGRAYGHVIDPRTGQPVASAMLAAVALPSATETDALSTALLTLGSAGHDRIASLRPAMRTLVLEAPEAGGYRVCARGITARPPAVPRGAGSRF